MQINKDLTSLITRLEEEYGKATPFPWKVGDDEHGEYLMILQDGPEGQNGQITSWSHYELEQCHGSLEDVRPDATFITDAHNSMPTLLSALKHFMKVAEAGEYLFKALEDAHNEFPTTGYWSRVKNAAVLAAYERMTGEGELLLSDTPSN